MRVPGYVVVLVCAVAIGLFMFGVAKVGTDLRPDYHVVSGPDDTERYQVDLSDARVVWLEKVKEGVAVMQYDIASKARKVLEPSQAAPSFPVLLDSAWVAWVEGRGPYHVAAMNLPSGAKEVIGDTPDNVTLPGRTLDGDMLLVAGTMHEVAGWWLVHLGTQEPARLLGPLPARGPVAMSGGLVWWGNGTALVAVDTERGGPVHVLDAGGRVLEVDARGDLVVWTADLGPIRGVRYANLTTGLQGNVTGVAGDQHSPAVDGTRVAFVQWDGLVRLADLANGGERVLPARDQENLHPRLTASWVAWLSGTLEGHNVLLVPAGG